MWRKIADMPCPPESTQDPGWCCDSSAAETEVYPAISGRNHEISMKNHEKHISHGSMVNWDVESNDCQWWLCHLFPLSHWFFRSTSSDWDGLWFRVYQSLPTWFLHESWIPQLANESLTFQVNYRTQNSQKWSPPISKPLVNPIDIICICPARALLRSTSRRICWKDRWSSRSAPWGNHGRLMGFFCQKMEVSRKIIDGFSSHIWVPNHGAVMMVQLSC